MAFLAKALFQWNKSSKNADISILSNFLAIFSDFFLRIEKFYQVLSTCQISDQLDHPNRNYRGGQNPPLAIPICKKPSLFRVKTGQGSRRRIHTANFGIISIIKAISNWLCRGKRMHSFESLWDSFGSFQELQLGENMF